jgi:hypothetical protein
MHHLQDNGNDMTVTHCHVAYTTLHCTAGYIFFTGFTLAIMAIVR